MMKNKRKKNKYAKRYARKLLAEKRDNLLFRINDNDSSDSSDSEPNIRTVLPISHNSETDSSADSSTTGRTIASFSIDTQDPVNSTQCAVNDDVVESDIPSDASIPDSIEYRYSSSGTEGIVLDSDSDSEGDYFYDAEEEKNRNFIQDIQNLVIEHNIDQVTTNKLLQILRANTNAAFPADSRTLLKTPRRTPTLNIEGGQYYHFGLDSVLKKMIRDANANKCVYVNNISLMINIDGAPLHKSSVKGIWPIQCSSNISNRIYLIGLFFGPSKPKNNDEFLKMFVDDTKNVINNNFEYMNETYTVTVSAFICDTPAKSMILNVKGHSGYSSCCTCDIKGRRVENVTCFPLEPNTQERTDENFRNLFYLGTYQNGSTILTDIPGVDFVNDFPRDYMHLICLGVTRKLLYLWIYGPRGIHLNKNQLEIISNRLNNFFYEICTDFSRRPRTLKQVKYWKATECRQFLLYTGPIVLKNVLDEEKYNNFILLHVAMRILTDIDKVSNPENINVAERLLKSFVSSYTNLYGSRYVSHNIHNLLHVAEDVRRYGAVDNYSAFKFENLIFFLKKLLRKNNQCLEQIIRRYKELDEIAADVIKKKKGNEENYVCSKIHRTGPLVINLNGGLQYKKFTMNSTTLSCDDDRNNCIIMKDCTAIRCLNFVIKNNRTFIVGKKLRCQEEIFNYPCSSFDLDCFFAEQADDIEYWDTNDIKRKACVLKYSDKFAVIPLLHNN